VFFRQRYYGQFSSRLDLHDFPFDRHTIQLQLVIPGQGPDDIELVPDPTAIQTGQRDDLSIPDWSVGPLRLRTEAVEVVPGARKLAGITAEFDASRHLGYYVGKAFVSVSMIVFMSWIVFWLDPSAVAPRISVSVTSMLTLVAYRFLLDSALPPVSYMTLLDYLLLGMTGLVFGALVEVTISSRYAAAGNIERARQLDRRARWVFPGAYILLFVTVFWAA